MSSILALTHKKVASPEALPARIPAARGFDSSQVAASLPLNGSYQYNQLAVNNPSQSTQSCPLSIANPRACPTGGVCHLCPARS